MKQFRNYSFGIVFLFFCQVIYAQDEKSKQDEKPKVALVLSGGGAKGAAHIPLLQTLDSLGIVPDLVVIVWVVLLERFIPQGILAIVLLLFQITCNGINYLVKRYP